MEHTIEISSITTKNLLDYLKEFVESECSSSIQSHLSTDDAELKLWGYCFQENCTGFFFDIPSPFATYGSWSRNYEDRKHNFMVYCELQRDMNKMIGSVIEIEKGVFKGWYLYLIKDSKNLPQVCLCKKRPNINTGWWSSIINFFSRVDVK